VSVNIHQFPSLTPLEYQKARPQIRSGDILLCSGASIFSTLIQKATNSIWSHVAFIIRLDVIDRIMVLESVESIGVRTVPLSSYVQNYNATGKGYPGQILIARHSQFNEDSIRDLSQKAVDLFGYPYDSQEIVRIAARISMKSLGFSKNDPYIQPGKAFICSEYAYDCYRSIGINIYYDPTGFVAPADFAQTPMINTVFPLRVKMS
jgi:hypothetical protein